MSRSDGPGRAGRSRRTDSLARATEVSLFGVTLAAIVGMHLLFADGRFFPALVLQALVAHVTLSVLRRLDVRLAPAAAIAAAAAVLSITWLQYLDTTIALLPSHETWSTVDRQIDEAWRLFQDVRAPAPVVPGFVVATSLAVWVIVFIADWGAFRTGVSFEALLPPATLFLFAAVLGEPGGSRAPGAALFVAAALVFLLLHRTWRQEGTATWAAVSRQQGRWSMLSSGAALAAIPVIASAVVGPRLPGADDPPVVPWRQLTDEEQPRVVISPLVDIRSRLVDQADLQVFTVRTDRPLSDDEQPYWRITALDSFDGNIWRSSYDTDRADGELPRSVDAPGAETTQVEQTITIEALDAIWLPAAHEPIALDLGNSETKVDYDEASETLIVHRDTPTSDGLSYAVTSELPSWSEAALQAAPAEIPQEIADRYTDLPQGFSPRIRDLATQWTAGATTQYDKARALQDHLRDFPYDQSVQQGHSEDALEDFLFVNQRGYCEQFAGAFAAMARSLDIPARVAVGFTTGTRDDFDPTLWTVTGRQAHAWVEVYFPDYGWVTFEPTPGRAPAGGDAWLGDIGAAQANPGGGGQGNGTTQTTDNVAPNPGGGGPTPAGTGDRNVDTGRDEEIAVPEPDDDSPFLSPALVGAALWVGLGVLVYLVVVPLALVALRWLRRLRARSPAEKVDLAWREATEGVAEAGVSLPPSLTVSEQARRMQVALPDQAAHIDLVARWVEQINYAEVAPSTEEADEAARAAGGVVAAAAGQLPVSTRVLRYVDARRLLPQPEHARRSAQSVVRTG
jgi:transglutaminase-like putative cysteine protease